MIRATERRYLPIDGIEPDIRGGLGFYQDMNFHVLFTGTIRLAKNLIAECYVHMGYQKASAFKTVLDITLQAGRIINVQDRSQEAEENRGAFKRYYEDMSNEDVVGKAFSLDMDLM